MHKPEPQKKTFKRVLVANRGEIALRIIRALKEMKIESVALYSNADSNSQHLRFADYAYSLKGHTARDTYLNTDEIIKAIVATKADAVHPGYGFLSENPKFASQIEQDTKAVFIGPSSKSIAFLGDKLKAKEFMKAHKIPTVPGSDTPLSSFKKTQAAAKDLTYPLILKASFGGGGKGMRIITHHEQLKEAYESCVREAYNYFGNDQLLLERYIKNPRHIEVQILCDHHGNSVHLFERDCSIQRRHQKIIEEAPSRYLDEQQREKMGDLSVYIAKSLNYQGVGTVEYICESPDKFYFMEMNTRIQVEHPVTEMITGIDLIKEQIKCAAGNKLHIKQEDLTFKGSAIEIRINAEDPKKDFLPSTGRITHLHLPSGPFIRTDSHIYQGYTIPTLYDSLLAKIIAWGNTREEALSRMACALDEIVIEGIVTNISFQKQILRNPVFKSEKFSTNFLDQEKYYFDNNDSNIALKEEELCAALAVIISQLGQENKSKAPSYSHPHWLHEARKENIKDQNALGYSLRQS